MRSSHICSLVLFILVFLCCGIASAADVKVLLYHDVSETVIDSEIPTAIPLDMFYSQMLWLKGNGYTALTVTEMFQKLDAGELPAKTVCITFDDGYTHIYDEVFPLMKDLGFPATTYLIGEKINTAKNLTGENIHEMYEAGWEIGSHSMTHADLQTSDNLDYEICYSKQYIASAAEIPADKIVSFAYPYGSGGEREMTKVYKCGFTSGGGLGNMFIDKDKNPFYFARYSMLSTMNMDDFAAIFSR